MRATCAYGPSSGEIVKPDSDMPDATQRDEERAADDRGCSAPARVASVGMVSMRESSLRFIILTYKDNLSRRMSVTNSYTNR